MTARRMLQSENPFRPEPVMALPMNPPMNAPTIPISIVTMMPPGSFPGMSALAIAPAIKPSTIQARIPIAQPPGGSGLRDRVSEPLYHGADEDAIFGVAR